MYTAERAERKRLELSRALVRGVVRRRTRVPAVVEALVA